ncbi:reactive chlorine resistance periplasmic protein RclB [Escherichia coli]|uniref:reactive chlorine resistance periplasmic protein RclB n=2 Tax=Escherichia coli TaxID=562 RepID=UPI0004042902|nr:reactive chlorine resistance periplasmic protein RclB [Escherichia coli]
MFKKSVLFATLLSGVMAFSTNADDKIILKHISVSSVSASPTVLENAIADMARKYNASSWKVTSMRIDNNSQQQYCINKDVYNGKIPAPVKSGR